MKIFNSQTIHELDKVTCEVQKISSVDLMERAASAVTCEIVSRFLPSQRFVVMAGPGNNGGDALAVARMLIEQGYKKVEIFLFNVAGKLSPDCEEERKRLKALENVDFTEVSREFTPPYIGESDVVIDGLFGSGLSQPLMGGFVFVARYINESKAYVISIDLPSGLFGEDNLSVVYRDIVAADLTLVFQVPRLSFFFKENAGVLGEWKLLDIGLDEKKMKEIIPVYTLVEARNIRPLIRVRDPFTGKRDYGSAMIYAGSAGMMGAGVMAARAALKTGAGLVTVHSASIGMNILQTAVPEAMFEPDRNDNCITDMTLHHAHKAVAVGPGIGTRSQTVDALAKLLMSEVFERNTENNKRKYPERESHLILDADALNCIVSRPELLGQLPPKTILTPHIGEFDRLFGEHNTSQERLQTAIDKAKEYNVIIVLKGHYTATVRPTGRVYFNSTGNPGMATAGAGDVLTGVIAGLLAQGYQPEHAATIGVYIHGLAGDLAAEEFGEYGLTAGDIADYIGRAIKHIMHRK